jgi:hypothetical protein
MYIIFVEHTGFSERVPGAHDESWKSLGVRPIAFVKKRSGCVR